MAESGFTIKFQSQLLPATHELQGYLLAKKKIIIVKKQSEDAEWWRLMDCFPLWKNAKETGKHAEAPGGRLGAAVLSDGLRSSYFPEFLAMAPFQSLRSRGGANTFYFSHVLTEDTEREDSLFWVHMTQSSFSTSWASAGFAAWLLVIYPEGKDQPPDWNPMCLKQCQRIGDTSSRSFLTDLVSWIVFVSFVT